MSEELKLTPADIVAQSEPWCEVMFANGDKIRARVNIVQAFEIVGGKDGYGNQAYHLEFNVTISSTIPPRGKEMPLPANAAYRKDAN